MRDSPPVQHVEPQPAAQPQPPLPPPRRFQPPPPQTEPEECGRPAAAAVKVIELPRKDLRQDQEFVSAVGRRRPAIRRPRREDQEEEEADDDDDCQDASVVVEPAEESQNEEEDSQEELIPQTNDNVLESVIAEEEKPELPSPVGTETPDDKDYQDARDLPDGHSDRQDLDENDKEEEEEVSYDESSSFKFDDGKIDLFISP